MDNDAHQKTSVLIVGAGPTGLVLALWLRKQGVPFRIIDKSAAPGLTSRALAVQARTLEFYRQLGIAEDVIGGGILARELVLRRSGKIIAKARLGALGEGISPYPYLLFFPQDLHEKVLVNHLAKLGVTVERGTELKSFVETEGGVWATVKTPQGEERIEAEYLCGCDGAHSVVRHGMGVGFPGGKYEQVFFVADVVAKGEMAAQGVQISVAAKGFCIVMPIPTMGSVRLTGIVPPESQTMVRITFADVAQSVQESTGLVVEKVNWFSSYNVHHRVADRFQKGRVFLAGDAGHIHSPAGGQGMNTGIGDAVNLAWKLADVVQGRAAPSLLETYETERIAFARVLVASTDRAFQAIASPSWLGSMWRAYGLPKVFATLAAFEAFQKLAFRTISQVRIRYPGSALSQGQAGEVRGGDRLPWVKQSQGDNHESLKSLAWQLHVYGEFEEGFRARVTARGLQAFAYEWNADAQAKGLQKDAAYLIRPDGHVAFAQAGQDAAALEAYLARLIVKKM